MTVTVCKLIHRFTPLSLPHQLLEIRIRLDSVFYERTFIWNFECDLTSSILNKKHIAIKLKMSSEQKKVFVDQKKTPEYTE